MAINKQEYEKLQRIVLEITADRTCDTPIPCVTTWGKDPYVDSTRTQYPTDFIPQFNETPKETDMYTNTPIATPTIIFGKDLTKCTEQDLIDAIRKVKEDIEKVADIKGSNKITERREEAVKQIKSLTEYLDKL